MSDLKPAHEVICDKIVRLGEGLEFLDRVIAAGGGEVSGKFMPPEFFAEGRSQSIGSLCTLLEVLERMVIPEGGLDRVIQQLAALIYRHEAITGAIETLNRRRTATVGQ